MVSTLLAVALATQMTAPHRDYLSLTDEQIELCFEAQDEYNISAALCAAIIQVESSGRATAQNGSCHGLMQVDECHVSDVAELYEPASNIKEGMKVLADCCERADGELYLALMKYNGASNADAKFDEWIEAGAHGYPTDYVKKVVTIQRRLEREWDRNSRKKQ